MRIVNEFEVPAAPPDTYELLVDLERVASCIPGGEVGARGDDGSHPASIAVALGPMRMKYRGTVRIEERDDAARRAVLVADVREQRGQGTAKASMTMAVSKDGAGAGSGSLVATITDVKLTGRAAQMGRGVVDDVAARLVAEMAACITARFERPAGDDASGGAGQSDGDGGPPQERTKPIGGFRLMMRVFWERLKRVFRREGGESNA
jgi:carbon monoxide dehydrogenase subunit G